MEDTDIQRDIGTDTTETVENDREMALEPATSDVTLPFATHFTPSSSTLGGHSSSAYSNSHHAQVRRSSDDREEDLLLLESEEDRQSANDPSMFEGSPMCLGPRQVDDATSTNTQQDSEQVESIAHPLENMSLRCTTIPQQESCGLHGDESTISTFPCRANYMDVEMFHRNLKFSDENFSQRQLCIMFLFKRGIISRDELKHVLYFVPQGDFEKKLPKIKQYEAVVCHGTEFPFGEENQPMSECLLYHNIEINDFFSVRFEIVNGDNFSIVCPPSMTVAHVSQICSRGEDRIGGGYSITVLTKCTGGKDKLFQDRVRMIIQSGNATKNLTFPISCYESNVSPWLYNPHAVTAMPDEDREILRSSHMKLIENIGDVIYVCEHLYQHKILDCDDLEEIRSITRRTDRNAYVLRTIQTRGNILDLVIEIMRGKRENQEAAAILQRERFQRTDRK